MSIDNVTYQDVATISGGKLSDIKPEQREGALKGAQILARSLQLEGVDVVFGYPGATNLVTGIADANSDSIPIVAITGNVPSQLLGRNAFQEVDIVSIVKPITKRAYLVDRVARIPPAVRLAFTHALGNRPGPVLIDIPKDIQQHYPRDPDGNYAEPRMPAVIEPPEDIIEGMHEDQLQECLRLIADAERPVLYVGGGIVAAGAGAVGRSAKRGSPAMA